MVGVDAAERKPVDRVGLDLQLQGSDKTAGVGGLGLEGLRVREVIFFWQVRERDGAARADGRR
jgi:hypothetical protein